MVSHGLVALSGLRDAGNEGYKTAESPFVSRRSGSRNGRRACFQISAFASKASDAELMQLGRGPAMQVCSCD